MTSSKSLDVVISVTLDVLFMPLAELLDTGNDVLHATFGTHLLGGDVGVGTGTVPVSIERLGSEGNHDSEFLCDPDKQESCEPHLISCVDASGWSNLEFPLRRHDLGIDSRYWNLAVETCFVVYLDEISREHFTCADSTVVWTLWGWVTAGRPAIRSSLLVHESVLLLDSEPGLVNLVLLGQLGGFVSVVELVWSSIVLPTFGHDDDVVSTSERVLPELDRAKEDIRVVTLSLTSGRSIKVPLLQVCNRLWLAGQCHRL